MSDDHEPPQAEAPVESSDGETTELEYGCVVSWSGSQKTIHVPRDRWLEVGTELLADGWQMCVDVTSVDYSAYEPERDLPSSVTPERYEVVASFVSMTRRERIRARAQVPADDPSIDSLYAPYPGTDFLEREVYDLMGITFNGHPDLSRIVLPEHWQGHPLRKDFAIGSIPVQFKGAGTRSDS